MKKKLNSKFETLNGLAIDPWIVWVPHIKGETSNDITLSTSMTKWYDKSGLPIKRFFNTSGLLYKSLELKDKLPQMSEDEALKLLATDGMLVKRPILVSDDFVLVGFKQPEWEEKIKFIQ